MFPLVRILRPALKLLGLVLAVILGWQAGGYLSALVGGSVPYLVWVSGWMFPLIGAAFAGLLAGGALFARR